MRSKAIKKMRRKNGEEESEREREINEGDMRKEK